MCTLSDLTRRERDVLELMAKGHSNSRICTDLMLGEKTVETHIRHIFEKLRLPASGGTHRRVTAVLQYLDALAVS